MFEDILDGTKKYYFAVGNSVELLSSIPDNSIDCVITSPPYWQQRIYEDFDGALSDMIGSEKSRSSILTI